MPGASLPFRQISARTLLIGSALAACVAGACKDEEQAPFLTCQRIAVERLDGSADAAADAGTNLDCFTPPSAAPPGPGQPGNGGQNGDGGAGTRGGAAGGGVGGMPPSAGGTIGPGAGGAITGLGGTGAGLAGSGSGLAGSLGAGGIPGFGGSTGFGGLPPNPSPGAGGI